MFDWLKKNPPSPYQGIDFQVHGGAPYHVNSGGSSSCYGYIGGQHACSIEGIQVNANTLQTNHFALHDAFIGTGMGERCLRAFAELIAAQNPQINRIELSIYQTTSSVKKCSVTLKKVADARETLLVTLGAVGITKVHQNPDCWEVTGVWQKAQW